MQAHHVLGRCVRIILVCLVAAALSSAAHRNAGASEFLIAGAAKASTGLNGCNTLAGQALYRCVADVLQRLANDIQPARVSATQSALLSAASQLRAATTKAQALSAIAAVQSVVASALAKVRAIGGGYVQDYGDSGLNAISSVLVRASRLIQSKG